MHLREKHTLPKSMKIKPINLFHSSKATTPSLGTAGFVELCQTMLNGRPIQNPLLIVAHELSPHLTTEAALQDHISAGSENLH